MLELLFVIGMLWIFGKLLFVGIRAAWSVSKILVTLVLLPLGADSLSAYWFDLYSITNSFNNRNHVIVYKTVRFSLN